MSSRKKNGSAVESLVMRMYHASPSFCDEYDCETKKKTFEVKSCRYLIALRSGLRGYQLGRFTVSYKNHVRFRTTSASIGKVPQYVFVMVVGKCLVQRSVSWIVVDQWLKHSSPTTHIPLRLVFGDNL